MKGARIHCQHQIIEIAKDIIDRAKGTAGFGCQIARAQRLQSIFCDAPLRDVDQILAQGRAPLCYFTRHDTLC